MAAVDTPRETRSYGNWRRPRSPGLGALGMLGTMMLLAGLIVVILVVAVAGLAVGAVVGVVIGLALTTLILPDRYGKTLLQRLGMRGGWVRAKASGSHLYRSGPLGRTPWGRFQLPGLSAQSQLSEATDSYGRPFALLEVPATGHYTVVFATEPDGASLVDEEQIDSWVAHWGNWLASLADEPGLAATSVTVETAPDSGARLQREVLGHMDNGAPLAAKAMLREVVDTYPEGSATIRAWVALTFRAAVSGKRRGRDEMARLLAARLPALGQRLGSTGAGAARPVTAQQLCELVRIAYDPQAAELFDAAYSAGDVPALAWDDVGPAATEAGWADYRHDNARSVTWSMTAAPRGEVQSSVLYQLLAPHADIARKRVTLLYRPLDSADAARLVEQDKRVADFRATSSKRPSARIQAEQRSATATTKEEAKGAGLVNFGLVVTATVDGDGSKQGPDAEAAVDNLAATARIQLRRVYGSQDSAFAAALPLGLVLPSHLNVPEEIRATL